MDSVVGYARLSAVSWRTLGTIAAGLAAIGAASSGHTITALVLGCAALLAAMEAGYIVVRPAKAALSRPFDASAAREADRLRALLDAVGTALFVLSPDGRIVFANRAARTLAGADVARLGDVVALGPAAAADLGALLPGARRIVGTSDGRSLLAKSGRFAAPGELPQRLLSLQWIAGELDAVEIEAWHAMTRVLAHEMMNSLTPIVSLAESLAAQPKQTATAMPALETIGRRASHLLRFVERYRELGDLPHPNPVSFDLAALLHDIAGVMTAELTTSGIAVSTRNLGSSVTITGDPELLERAFINLLRNSIEAVKEETQPEINIEVSRKSDGVTVTIRDNGIGIPPARMNDVFVPFFSTKQGGSGVGLTLARQIASLHGGTLIAKPARRGLSLELFLPGGMALEAS